MATSSGDQKDGVGGASPSLVGGMVDGAESVPLLRDSPKATQLGSSDI